MLKREKWYAIINLYEGESLPKCTRGSIIIIKVPASDEKINTAVTWSQEEKSKNDSCEKLTQRFYFMFLKINYLNSYKRKRIIKKLKANEKIVFVKKQCYKKQNV